MRQLSCSGSQGLLWMPRAPSVFLWEFLCLSSSLPSLAIPILENIFMKTLCKTHLTCTSNVHKAAGSSASGPLVSLLFVSSTSLWNCLPPIRANMCMLGASEERGERNKKQRARKTWRCIVSYTSVSVFMLQFARLLSVWLYCLVLDD